MVTFAFLYISCYQQGLMFQHPSSTFRDSGQCLGHLCYCIGVEGSAISWVAARYSAEHPSVHGVSPQQRITRPQMLTVPGLRTAALHVCAIFCTILLACNQTCMAYYFILNLCLYLYF